ncbi:MAG: hypothetical protein LWW85_15950, partial [Marinilabiliales bacterium]|nr:hypothetical protein [Marinilabiliales bacterium]
KDKMGRIWVMSQSFPGNSNKKVASLQCIDPINYQIVANYSFREDEHPVKLNIDAAGDYLFFLLGNQMMKMSVSAPSIPDHAYLTTTSQLLYALGIDPLNGDIYLGDALDYQRPGVVKRYSSTGRLLDTFQVGIIPGRFCFQ